MFVISPIWGLRTKAYCLVEEDLNFVFEAILERLALKHDINVHCDSHVKICFGFVCICLYLFAFVLHFLLVNYLNRFIDGLNRLSNYLLESVVHIIHC